MNELVARIAKALRDGLRDQDVIWHASKDHPEMAVEVDGTLYLNKLARVVIETMQSERV